MIFTEKPFARGSSAFSLEYGKIVDSKFVSQGKLYKHPDLKKIGSKSVSGSYGKSSYKIEYDLDEKKIDFAIIGKFYDGIGTTRVDIISKIIFQRQ